MLSYLPLKFVHWIAIYAYVGMSFLLACQPRNSWIFAGYLLSSVSVFAIGWLLLGLLQQGLPIWLALKILGWFILTFGYLIVVRRWTPKVSLSMFLFFITCLTSLALFKPFY